MTCLLERRLELVSATHNLQVEAKSRIEIVGFFDAHWRRSESVCRKEQRRQSCQEQGQRFENRRAQQRPEQVRVVESRLQFTVDPKNARSVNKFDDLDARLHSLSNHVTKVFRPANSGSATPLVHNFTSSRSTTGQKDLVDSFPQFETDFANVTLLEIV